MASSSSSIKTSVFFMVLLPLLFCFVEAREFLVGGKSDGWKVPFSSSESLNKWTEANRFQIGDVLVWRIDEEKDSVLQVTRDDYFSCNTSSPLAVPENKDGTTTLKLERNGAHYFISGAKGACEKGQKVIVVVMAMRRNVVISPAPSPTEVESPAPLPVTGGVHQMRVVGWSVVGGLALGIMGIVW